MQRDIAQSEYHIPRDCGPADPAAGYQSPNRAQNFRTYFDGDGIRLIPRTTQDEVPAWEWRLTLAGWGRQGSMTEPAGAPQVSVNGNRVEYRRGDLTEWYVNDARGLEQGFTIDRRPGSGEAGSLRVELAVGGSLKASLAEDGQTVDFLTPAGARAIRFDHLSVVDAGGRELPARFERREESGNERVAIVVDDADAVYPIVIDPLVTNPNWFAESNQANASFGNSVSTAGDVNGDGFSDVIVGAPAFDNGQTNEGRVFVYHGSAAGLSVAASWTAESNQAN
ncbi:MAG: FG-GAP repeat-containing protein, partial [bacterium]